MKKIVLSTFLLIIGLLIYGQTDDPVHDPKALEILNKLSDRYAQDSTIRIYFEYNYYNAQDSSEDHFKGYLFVKGEKYKLIMPKTEIFSDGKKVYSFNMQANELNITLYDPNSQDILTPSHLLDVYKEGFKYRLRSEVEFDAKVKTKNKITTRKVDCYVIELYPENPKGVPYSIIRVWIEKNENQLISIMYQGKNGVQQVVNILEIKENLRIPDQLFIFDRKKYPKDVEIIDFTEE